MQFLNEHTSKYQKRSKHFVCFDAAVDPAPVRRPYTCTSMQTSLIGTLMCGIQLLVNVRVVVSLIQ